MTYLLFQFPFYFKSFKRDIIVLNFFLVIFVSISFLVNIGKEMSLPGFRSTTYVVRMLYCLQLTFGDSENLKIYLRISNELCIIRTDVTSRIRHFLMT